MNIKLLDGYIGYTTYLDTSEKTDVTTAKDRSKANRSDILSPTGRILKSLTKVGVCV